MYSERLLDNLGYLGSLPIDSFNPTRRDREALKTVLVSESLIY
jgi:hypothetical protein